MSINQCTVLMLTPILCAKLLLAADDIQSFTYHDLHPDNYSEFTRKIDNVYAFKTNLLVNGIILHMCGTYIAIYEAQHNPTAAWIIYTMTLPSSALMISYAHSTKFSLPKKTSEDLKKVLGTPGHPYIPRLIASHTALLRSSYNYQSGFIAQTIEQERKKLLAENCLRLELDNQDLRNINP